MFALHYTLREPIHTFPSNLCISACSAKQIYTLICEIYRVYANAIHFFRDFQRHLRLYLQTKPFLLFRFAFLMMSLMFSGFMWLHVISMNEITLLP